MAAGLPVITTRHAGIPYVVQDGVSGLLVAENSIDELKTAILHLASDAEKRQSLGLAASAFALEHLDVRKKEVDLETLYDEIKNRSACR